MNLIRLEKNDFSQYYVEPGSCEHFTLPSWWEPTNIRTKIAFGDTVSAMVQKAFEIYYAELYCGTSLAADPDYDNIKWGILNDDKRPLVYDEEKELLSCRRCLLQRQCGNKIGKWETGQTSE